MAGAAVAAVGGRRSGAASAASVTSVRMVLPSLTRSLTLTFNSATTPASGEGTSMEALSDSSVTSGCSGAMLSPGLTMISMIGTSLKIADVGNAHFCNACRRARCRRRRRYGRLHRLACDARPIDFKDQNGRTFADLVADLDRKRLHHARSWRRDLHGGLVRFERDQGTLGGDTLARLHLYLNDRDILEVADVGYTDLRQLTHYICLP